MRIINTLRKPTTTTTKIDLELEEELINETVINTGTMPSKNTKLLSYNDCFIAYNHRMCRQW